MASIKLKFRPSSVKGKKGVLSYQIIHYRLTRLIKTSYRIMPSEVGRLYRQSAYFNTV